MPTRPAPTTASAAAPASAPSTAERVRRAALELFAERGFHGTGIRQLAEHAGVSSASLYHYMGTKEDLLVSLMRESLERLLADARACRGAPRERVEALVRQHVRAHGSRPLETRVGDDEVHALSPAARSEVVALRDAYEAVWGQAISDGVAAGAFHVASPGLARRALLEMCSGVARWFDPAGPRDLDELAEEYVALALRLLGADPAAP